MAQLLCPDPPLSDGVVTLRAWSASDIGFVVAACQDREVSRYSPVIPFPYVEGDARGWFDAQPSARLAGESLDLAIAQADSGQPLGAIGLNAVNETLSTADIGYWLAGEARGRGNMTRAVRLLAAWAFADLGLARLQLTTDPENLASQRVAERCGFKREGHLRSHMRVRHSGERRDSLVYGLLPGELTPA